jgi:hypothetical protein
VDNAIDEFCSAFGRLAEELDTGLMVQSALVSLRIDTRVQESGS